MARSKKGKSIWMSVCALSMMIGLPASPPAYCAGAKEDAAQDTTPNTDTKSDAVSEPKKAKPAAKDIQTITILFLRQKRELLPPLSLLSQRPKDDGLGGAKLAIADNNTTGRFLKQKFELEVFESDKPDALIAEAVARVSSGTGMIVTDVNADVLLALADDLIDKDAILLNAGARDDNLRNADCRANILHVAPSRAMLADALGQYLTWKRWDKWFLVAGTTARDKLWVNAIKRTAKRFRQKIVEERVFDYNPGSRRADGGYEQIQKQIPKFTQKAPRHDVVVVADEGQLFADYFAYRTWEARPVVGSAGLAPASWHPAVELWGGTQFQNRFKRMNKRNMRELDYDVWMAVRTVGEAASRTRSNEPSKLISYIRSKDFELAAFKGQKLTYRDWNGQLRQPVILVTPNLHVTVSPQPEFLHQFSELDTLGYDRPESTCKAYKP